MAELLKKCVPPCDKSLPEGDLHEFCLECLGEEHACLGLQGECEYCDLLPIKVLRARLAFFKEKPRAAAHSWGSRADLADAHETEFPLSLALSPDQEVLASTSQARSGASCEGAEEFSSLASMEVASSQRSSSADRAFEELLEVITRAAERLHIDWPQQRDSPKRSRLNDRCLSGGRGGGASTSLPPLLW